MKAKILLFSGLLAITVGTVAFVHSSRILPQAKIAASDENAWLVRMAISEKAIEAIDATKEIEDDKPSRIHENTSSSIASIPSIASSVAPSPRITPLLPIVDQEDILPHHREIANEVLRLLPVDCRAKLKNFYVRYDNPERRGLAGKTTVIVTGNLGDNEFRGLLLHETLGHFWDLGCLTGTPKSGASAFRDGKEVMNNDDPSVAFYAISWVKENIRRPESKAEDFVSGYAVSDAYEDLAESVAFYILQNGTFRKRAETNTVMAAKLQWLDAHIPVSLPLADGSSSTKNIPWDATRTAYVWNQTR